MTDLTIKRPDPKHGGEAGPEYAAAYVALHVQEINSLTYRLGYAALFLLDGLLKPGYLLLDVGCGTGGYHRFLQNHGQIIGVDFSPEMVVAANALKARYALDRVTYYAERFENYRSELKFDAVSLIGTFGWYVPWHGKSDILKATADLLQDDGVACLSYVPPRTLPGWLKAFFFSSRTTVMRKATMAKMLKNAGFLELLELNYPHVTVVLAKKTTASMSGGGRV